jgi:hypothetical protein
MVCCATAPELRMVTISRNRRELIAAGTLELTHCSMRGLHVHKHDEFRSGGECRWARDGGKHDLANAAIQARGFLGNSLVAVS